MKIIIEPHILLPDGSLIQDTHREELNLSPSLTKRDKKVHIFPQLQYGALISMVQLCNDVYTTTFTATHRREEKQDQLVLEDHQ